MNTVKSWLPMTNEEVKTVNHFAREEMKLKLLADIRLDLEICDIKG